MDIELESSQQSVTGDVELVQTLAKSDLPFSAPQLMVLHGMGDGKSVTKAARLAGVHRTTVHVWRKENADYEAAFQEWKRQGRENARAGVISLTDLALRTAKKDMLKGGVKTALAILKSVGALDREPAGPTTGEEISEERMLEAEQKKIRQDERREKLIERHLKTAVARSERERALAAVKGDAPPHAKPKPSRETEDLTEAEEEENKERYMEAVRKIALGQDPDEDEQSAIAANAPAKPINSDDPKNNPSTDDNDDPRPRRLDARSA